MMNNKNFYYNKMLYIVYTLSIGAFILGIYIWGVIKGKRLFEVEFLVCTLFVCCFLCLFFDRLMRIALFTRLNYLEYADFLIKQMEYKKRYNKKSQKLEDELMGLRYIMKTDEISNNAIKNKKTKEYAKRYIAENYLIKGKYQEATNVLDSFELKVKDFRDDYLRMILLQNYEEAIKVIESKTNK